MQIMYSKLRLLKKINNANLKKLNEILLGAIQDEDFRKSSLLYLYSLTAIFCLFAVFQVYFVRNSNQPWDFYYIGGTAYYSIVFYFLRTSKIKYDYAQFAWVIISLLLSDYSFL